MSTATAATPDIAHSLRTRLLLLLFATIAIFAIVQGIGAYRGALQHVEADRKLSKNLG